MTTPQKVHGVDISHHQNGVIGWAALKAAGVKWMYHKATEGTTVWDENYRRRRVEAAKAGMPFGAYHFARPSGSDARAEARFFIGFAQPKPGDLRPCLDLETTGGFPMNQIQDWADAFCNEVEKLTSVTPLVYTPYTLSPALEKAALFWVPRYNNDNRPPVRQWDIWQFSNGKLGVPNTVSGLGRVDLNTSKVDLKDLLIPKAAAPVLTRGTNVDAAIGDLNKAAKNAEDGTTRDTRIKRALAVLKRIPTWKKK